MGAGPEDPLLHGLCGAVPGSAGNSGLFPGGYRGNGAGFQRRRHPFPVVSYCVVCPVGNYRGIGQADGAAVQPNGHVGDHCYQAGFRTDKELLAVVADLEKLDERIRNLAARVTENETDLATVQSWKGSMEALVQGLVDKDDNVVVFRKMEDSNSNSMQQTFTNVKRGEYTLYILLNSKELDEYYTEGKKLQFMFHNKALTYVSTESEQKNPDTAL